MTPEEIEAELKKLRDEILPSYAQVTKDKADLEVKFDNLKHQYRELQEQVGPLQDENSYMKNQVQMLEPLINIIRQVVKDAIGELPLKEMVSEASQGISQRTLVGIDKVLKMSHEERSIGEIKTDSIQGKILWILAHDLKGKWSTREDLKKVAEEKGWMIMANFYRETDKLVKDGLVGKKRVTDGIAFKLAEDVRVET